MKRSLLTYVSMLFAAILAVGCGTAEIPQAHRGQKFEMTGALAFYAGGKGLTGPILNPGTHYTGVYDEIRMMECGTTTPKESMQALTGDNVQFSLDIYVRFHPDCSDEAVADTLKTVTPDKGNNVSSEKLYRVFVYPAIGESVREAVSPFKANEVNEKRDKILTDIKRRILAKIAETKPSKVVIEDVVLSNMRYPDEMLHANTERAVQDVLKASAEAKKERMNAEAEMMKSQRTLSQREGEAEAAKIDAIGAALARNPPYLTYQLQQMMPGIYEKAGDKGNLVITAPSPSVLVTPRTK